MPDLSPSRRSPFEALRAVPVPTAIPTRLPPRACFVFRGRSEAIEAAGQAFIPLPREACRAATTGKRAALWLGPDEWLLLAPEAETAAIAQAFAALNPLPFALIDVSHRQAALTLSGPNAAPVLNAGCPLDLDLTAFPVGACTRTLLGKAEIVLWRTDDTTFHIEVWRSFTAYVWRFIEEAGREFVTG